VTRAVKKIPISLINIIPTYARNSVKCWITLTSQIVKPKLGKNASNQQDQKNLFTHTAIIYSIQVKEVIMLKIIIKLRGARLTCVTCVVPHSTLPPK
jgi:hypothetical protein